MCLREARERLIVQEETEMKCRVGVLAIAALGLLFAPVAFAQQQNDSSGGAASKPAAAPAQPDPPKSNGSSISNSNPHIKPGTDYPHWEFFAGFSFFDFRPGQVVTGTADNYGGSGGIAYNLNRWFGIAADIGGYTGKYTIGATGSGTTTGGGTATVAGGIILPGPVGLTGGTGGDPSSTANDTMYSFLFGPRFSYRNDSRFTPFGQVLFGAMYGQSGLPNSATASQTVFGFAAGGGIDIAITKHFSWRAVQTEYVYSRFNLPLGNFPQNNIRISSGLLFTWGEHPVMVNRPPVDNCTADKSSIVDGSGDTIGIHCISSDPDGDTLTNTWMSTGGRVDGTGTDVRWEQAGAAVGRYTVTNRVDDGHGGTASSSVTVAVTPKPAPPPPPQPPVMSCSVDRSTVTPGERVTVTATASSPQSFTLSYTWRANGGQVIGSGSSVQFDTTGLAAGTYTITGRVDDGHGQAADCSANVTVNQPPPPPEASKINECAFKPSMSSRVDNVCKRLLDDAAVRLQSTPDAKLVIVGYADPKLKTADKLGTQRAQNAAKYLESKGIDASRITARAGAGQIGAGAANQRIDIVWVPAGASY
jgi:outer membrane protein OmpA-like peptidoglycan-associated protein